MIGEGIDRLDGPLKVTGGAKYSAEYPTERLTYGVIVQSAVARGSITAFDTAAASTSPAASIAGSVRQLPVA